MKHHLRALELKLSALFLGLAIFLCGCSSSYTVSSAGKPNSEYSYQEMNEELTGRNVKIELKDGREISTDVVAISHDSVSWVDQRTDKKSKTSIREINKIVMKSHGIGALEGLGFGLVGGGGIGALIGQITWGNNTDWGTGAGALVGLILGGGTGLVVGPVTGLIIGHSYNYEFPTTEQSDSLQNGK